MRSLPGWVATTVLVSCSLLVIGHAAPVSASCMTGTPQTEDVTGDVVSTTVQKYDGVLVTVRLDDGSSRTVVLAGRYPDDPGISQEDACEGDLPEVGGRYLFRGLPDGGKLWLNACVDSVVQQLAAPVTTATTTDVSTTDGSTGGSTTDDTAGGNRWLFTVVGLVIGIGAVLVLLQVASRRRTGAADAGPAATGESVDPPADDQPPAP